MNIEWNAEPFIDGMRPDETLESWLTDSGLLTARLRRVCGSNFQLQLLENRSGPGGMLHHDRIRRVILRCEDTPCVYAESHVPESAHSSIPKLRTLGADPLGEALQARPDVIRGAFEYAIVDESHLPAEVTVSPGSPFWARRSKFRVAESYLTVAEIFLPGITRCR